MRSVPAVHRLAAAALAASLSACAALEMDMDMPLDGAGRALDDRWTDARIAQAASDAPPSFVPELRLDPRMREQLAREAGEVIAAGEASRARLAETPLDAPADPVAFAAQARARAVPPPQD